MISSKKRLKGNLSKEDSLFLHLLKYNHFVDKCLISEVLTELGISNALNCDRSYISRLIKLNENKGNILRKSSRIMDNYRKQYAFFLTEKGLKIASELKNYYKIEKQE